MAVGVTTASKASQPEFRILNNSQNFKQKVNMKEITVKGQHTQMLGSSRENSKMLALESVRTPNPGVGARENATSAFDEATPDPFVINQ
jgi:spore coat protein CotF